MAKGLTYNPVESFLSIQAQDFIEENLCHSDLRGANLFLSIQAQDFIEDEKGRKAPIKLSEIPEHSSSGLH